MQADGLTCSLYKIAKTSVLSLVCNTVVCALSTLFIITRRRKISNNTTNCHLKIQTLYLVGSTDKPVTSCLHSLMSTMLLETNFRKWNFHSMTRFWLIEKYSFPPITLLGVDFGLTVGNAVSPKLSEISPMFKGPFLLVLMSDITSWKFRPLFWNTVDISFI